MKTDEAILQTLKEKLQPEFIHLQDETERHRAHEQAGTGGHFILQIISTAFEGKSRVERHQMVFKALGNIMNEIHALSIPVALTPEEKAKNG